ncbi:MAG: DNA-3-methyladenine glycosylase 2 family protein [Anaerolineae bacterium]|jgi:DNA-3-methyladenine glycosylase II|nr:DNA-3-methyladenine glycosylase 2 family protein [Anaerolineae bacterium]MBT7192084.1 DNA-3-methyladenine glycosylase 2 family protein [Anaerolineae bacterium]MBT7990160.1 DNA-3-methyladenine glycosylase 2 family protein [Anaerolineae bacterium]
MIKSLDEKSLAEGVAVLIEVDDDLKAVVEQFGSPPLWGRKPGFATLLLIILEQQVSLASARAAFKKLSDAIERVSPESFLQLNDAELKGFGFSRQKTRYGRILSEALLSGELDLDALHALDDENVRKELAKLTGIGVWTANIYLLMVLRRPNIYPPGDLALAKAMQQVKKFPKIPTNEEQLKIAEAWKPWRAVGARILWHHYLST